MPRVGLLWRGVRGPEAETARTQGRLAPIFAALAEVGIDTEVVPFDESTAAEVREQLLGCDGVLVFVDPVSGAADRGALDPLLRDVAERGVRVSAHPDVILAMGTKEVLYRTRELGWGGDVDLYRSFEDFARRFPARVEGSPEGRVLKQYRGNGGIGVWKVIPLDATKVRVQGAHRRGTDTEDIDLAVFMARCEPYFGYSDGDGRLIDQPFQPRITEGIIRCYLVRNEVVGFCRQYPDPDAPPEGPIFGLPSAKTMFPATEPVFEGLRTSIERDWVPQMQQLVGVNDQQLPFLWDADFLYGPLTTDGTDTYVLCEINVSAVIPYPDAAPAALARTIREHLPPLRRLHT